MDSAVGATGTDGSVTLYELGVDATDDTTLYKYNRFGELEKVDDNGKVTCCKYNGFGELISETTGKITKQYEYDIDGNRTKLALLENDVVQYQTKYEYDSLNRLKKVTTPIGRQSYVYDKANRTVLRKNFRSISMITDNLKNRTLYTGAHPFFDKAFVFIEEYLKNPFENGNYKICGDDLYANIFDSTTKSDGVFEAHEKYIDIQFIVDGKEKVRCDYIDRLTPKCEYNDEGDYRLYEASAGSLEFTFEKNQFAVFFPEDGHMPSIAIGEPATVKKIVVKVKCM